MKLDEDMELFFSYCKLDWRNFSFEELVGAYRVFLSLIIDKDSKCYMDIDLLGFFVNAFSKILKAFFMVVYDENIEVGMYSASRLMQVKEKSSDEYTINDIVVGLSICILNNYVDNYMNSEDFHTVMGNFYVMFDNFYHIEKFCESVDKKVEDIQKGIGFKPS